MKQNYQIKSLSIGLMIIGIAILSSSIQYLNSYIYADEINPGVYSKDSKPFGIPYADWLIKHTQWLLNIPSDVNPAVNYTPEKCSTSQSGPVWFLTLITKGTEERTCTVPSDKAILLPILAGFCPEWAVLAEDTLTTCAKKGNEYGIIHATVDGKEINELQSYRTLSPIYNITVIKDNILGHTPGFGKGQTDGFFLFLEPLLPGNHTIHTTTSVLNPISPEYNYAAELTYHLVVKP